VAGISGITLSCRAFCAARACWRWLGGGVGLCAVYDMAGWTAAICRRDAEYHGYRRVINDTNGIVAALSGVNRKSY